AIRIDGLDYRHRDVSAHARVVDDVAAGVAAVDGPTTLDRFGDVLAHLAQVHPSRYVKLVDGLAAIGLLDVHPFENQTDALRFVAFVDRLYDAQVRIFADGIPLDTVFPEDMLAGGYSKKYRRAMSRVNALTTE
ncbi:MAG: cell division protein ZapE, partial [Salinibacterium sp.]